MQKLKLDPWDDKTILTSLAIAQAISLAYTGGVSDGVPPQVMTAISMVRASLLGLAVSFGMAKIVQGLPRIRGRVRTILAYSTVGALFVVSPAIVAASFLAPAWLYHVLAVVGCDLAAAAVALGARALADEAKPQPLTSERPAKAGAEAAKASGLPAPLFRCQREGCVDERTGERWNSDPWKDAKTQQRQAAGHEGQHKRKEAKL